MARLSNNFKGKVHEYLRKKIGAFDYRNGWMKSDCPYCGKKFKFGINLNQNRTNCFVCGPQGDIIKLIMFLENVETYAEVIKIINSGNYDGYNFKEEHVELRTKKDIILPDGFTSVLFGDSQVAKSARAYLKKRNLDLIECSRMGWGFCDKRGEYFGYLIIPFKYNNELTYFNARKFIGNGPKYNNPDVDTTGIGKAMIIYNRDALNVYRLVYLCEGAINAFTIGEQGIASGGKMVSRYQVNLIIKSQVERVVLLLDSDAKKEALDLAMQLVQYKKVKVVFLPDNKDVNDIGRVETMKLVYRTPYQDYGELLRLKQSL